MATPKKQAKEESFVSSQASPGFDLSSMTAEGASLYCRSCLDATTFADSRPSGGRNPLLRDCCGCAATLHALSNTNSSIRKQIAKLPPANRAQFMKEQNEKRKRNGGKLYKEEILKDAQVACESYEKEGKKEAEIDKGIPYSKFEERELLKGKTVAAIEKEWEEKMDDDSVPKVMARGQTLLVEFEGVVMERYKDSGMAKRTIQSKKCTSSSEVQDALTAAETQMEKRRKVTSYVDGMTGKTHDCEVGRISTNDMSNSSHSAQVGKTLNNVAIELENEQREIMEALNAAAVVANPLVAASRKKDTSGTRSKALIDFQGECDKEEGKVGTLIKKLESEIKEATVDLDAQLEIAKNMLDADAMIIITTESTEKKNKVNTSLEEFKTEAGATVDKIKAFAKSTNADTTTEELKTMQKDAKSYIGTLTSRADDDSAYMTLKAAIADVISHKTSIGKALNKKSQSKSNASADIDGDAIIKIARELMVLSPFQDVKVNWSLVADFTRNYHVVKVTNNKEVLSKVSAPGYFSQHCTWASNYCEKKKIDHVIAGIVKDVSKNMYRDTLSKAFGESLFKAAAFPASDFAWSSEIFDLQLFHYTKNYNSCTFTHYCLPEARFYVHGCQVIAALKYEDAPGSNFKAKKTAMEAMTQAVLLRLVEEKNGFVLCCKGGDLALIPAGYIVVYGPHESQTVACEGFRWSTPVDQATQTVVIRDLKDLIHCFPAAFPTGSSYHRWVNFLGTMF